MPSKSPAQERLMRAAAHNPAFAKKVGVPVSTAKEFNMADQRVKASMLRQPRMKRVSQPG